MAQVTRGANMVWIEVTPIAGKDATRGATMYLSEALDLRDKLNELDLEPTVTITITLKEATDFLDSRGPNPWAPINRALRTAIPEPASLDTGEPWCRSCNSNDITNERR